MPRGQDALRLCAMPLNVRGFEIYSGYFDVSEQTFLVEEIRSCLRAAPLFQPVTPRGNPMSVRMSSAGQFGWVSDRQGYRYEPKHPSGVAWPAIPERLLETWRDLLPTARPPECCLINWYASDAKMGMHQDKDEADMDQPVVSVSLGDEALFRMGNQTKGGKTESIWLRSGDVVVMNGPARRAFHGIDRVRANSSTLLPNGGRINLTLRVVT
ncbi:alpha-ketoglutarate-dependent dioxygenase AlkB family protein [Marivita hallyeonensis]|uniref:Alkylated DNA repair protein (DNA oxidative demethylase) n=1 Tax=Marivita hallyeonensis TaxID=996342 RepID=A0A1M5TKL5_9RHOB|nr:alpha-ketoglutarate-dependent dioxygenase AlkB [Marivita hallyeonensis]SHH51229.1 alkylated DNA repair protein (DNA oxidative demethylase) [Marivita hallyeonensis]